MQPIQKNKMKGVVALEYGEENPKFQMKDNISKPVWKKGKKQLLVRVLAASIGFGDIHMLSGKVRFVVKVEGGFPYIVGKDVCGIVQQVDEGSRFAKGDIIVGQSQNLSGAIAEFIILPESNATIKPKNVGILEAAASVDSSNTAYCAAEAASVKQGDRVLILGGSGGVGSAAIQICRIFGAQFIATTSTEKNSLQQLGADLVINYHQKNWWEIEQFRQKPFDVLIDCVGGNQHFQKSLPLLKSKKNGGKFIAVVGSQPNPVVQNVLQLFGFALTTIKRPIKSKFSKDLPQYPFILSQPKSERMDKVLDLLNTGKLKIFFQKNGPFEFTVESVKKAFILQASHHAHGKIVFKIGDF